MMLYSKNGSIPKPETDGTEGWIEVPEPPVAGEGQEVVWWYPPGWVVRPVMPAPVDGHIWSWSQSTEEWISCELPLVAAEDAAPAESIPSASVSDIILMSSASTI